MSSAHNGSTIAPTDATKQRIQRIAELRDQFAQTNRQSATHVGVPEDWLEDLVGDLVPGERLCGLQVFALDDSVHLQPVVLRVVE